MTGNVPQPHTDPRAQLREVFARAAVGDFSVPLDMPDEENEFTEIYVGVSIMLDVINRQLVELKEHASREKGLNHAKSEFVAFVSHQLRNPLSAIVWSATELSSHPLPPAAKEAIARIESATSQMTWLIDRILALSKIEMGAPSYRSETGRRCRDRSIGCGGHHVPDTNHPRSESAQVNAHGNGHSLSAGVYLFPASIDGSRRALSADGTCPRMALCDERTRLRHAP